MRDYGKVAPVFWTQGTGRRLRGSTDAQLLALYLMSCPASNLSGVYTISIPTIAHEIGITPARVKAALELLRAEDFALYDEESDLVWVVNLVLHQLGDSLPPRDKRIVAIMRALNPFRGHPFVRAWVSRYGRAFHVSDEFADAPSKALPKPLRCQEQEQEQDQEQEKEQEQETQPARARDPGASPGGVVALPDPAAKGMAEVVAHYQRYHPRSFPRGLRAGSKEAKLIRARLADGFTVADLITAIDGYHASPFHCGVNDRNQSFLDLELFVRDTKHVQKGLELSQAGPAAGAYSERDKGNAWAAQAWLAKSAAGGDG